MSGSTMVSAEAAALIAAKAAADVRMEALELRVSRLESEAFSQMMERMSSIEGELKMLRARDDIAHKLSLANEGANKAY